MDEKTCRLIAEWRRKADHDRGIAKLALDSSSEYTDGICFHAQQAAEKDIKACCILLGADFERRHDIAYLLDLISDKRQVPDDMYDWAEKLQHYAVEVRYPEIAFDPTFEEAAEAFELSLRFRKFLEETQSCM